MTTAPKVGIAPDDALIIDPGVFGNSAVGNELEELFVEFTNRNSQSPWQFELSPNGEIIVMPPVYYPGSFHEKDTAFALESWTREFGGESTGSNAAYAMPVTGGVLVPDAAWVSPERLATHQLIPGKPIPLCPDFVIEIRSGTDNLAPLHAKMRLYIQNGALLGWLIDARNRRVYVYRAGQTAPELLENPANLLGEDVLPGFTFEVARWIFDRI